MPPALRVDDSEEIDLLGLDRLRPGGPVTVRVRRPDGGELTFTATAALHTAREVEYVRGGGVLPLVMATLGRGDITGDDHA